MERVRVSPSPPPASPHMPRTARLSKPANSAALAAPELILVAEAARRCGWQRANTFRERFLASDEEACAMGLSYDEDGRAVVDSAAVAGAVEKVKRERAERDPRWRIKNLKRHGRVRPAKRHPEDPAT